MATIKMRTDIPQSKKLADILPLESADMFYIAGKGEPIFIGDKMVAYGEDDYDALGGPDVLCWSLAALLSLIPKHIKGYNILRVDIDEDTFALWYDEIGLGVNTKLPDITNESAVDACYEMIIKLHEINLL